MDKNAKTAIIGAGFGGLAAAWDLARAGRDVTVFESAAVPGGLAAGFKEPHWDWYVEKFYHHWFQSDRHMLGLIDELGLSGKVVFPRPFTVLLHDGRWYPFDSIPRALAFPGLGFGIHKLRFGLVGLYLKLTNNWKALERHSAHEWIRRFAGRHVYETMWEPMLIGKFGPFYKDVNMAWFWARLKARTTRLGTFEGGFQRFADEFAARLQGMGVRIRYETPVESIAPDDDGGLVVRGPGSEPEGFRQVLSTTSPGLLARLVPGLPPEYLAGLESLQHMGAVVLIYSLKHPLSTRGFYWFNIPKNAGYPFLALVEHTNFVSPEHFGGEHIVYCGDYLPVGHEHFTLSQDELVERFTPHLKKFNPDFAPGWINKTWLFRTPYAQPVPLLDHSRNIPAIRTPLPGLFFASMSQVYPWDRGTNFAVEIGREAAKMMVADRAG
ncbi:MAG TPA: NAD(P)/FAD-dependent oxidoreductase [Anaerolineales bacterium]|nr:NAD(P)/FAD-dependent oxidoreductase [Anaerolineales bacterium]